MCFYMVTMSFVIFEHMDTKGFNEMVLHFELQLSYSWILNHCFAYTSQHKTF
jgi:hypothetical protein